MLSTPNSVGAQVLSCLGVNINELAAEVKKLFKTGKAPASEAVPQTPRLVGALMYAAQEAESFGHTKVGTEHMLLGLLLEYDSVAAQLLMNIGVTVDRVRACIAELSANPSEEDGSEIRPDKPAE
jgi:ATP-dependent Clp protease ATP-binding subunit ClpC